MNVLSIQSHVAYGHVGNASATFPMQRLGVEVWPIHTVQFSNHTGYGAWRGQVFEAGLIADLVEGIAERGVLPACDAVLSGYMGSHETGEGILGAVARVKAANPAALYACDPVIGDVGRGIFVRPGIPEFMRNRAVPAADIVTPNLFELEYLTDRSLHSLTAVRESIAALHAMGPSAILVTSVLTGETPDDALDLLASSGQGCFRLRTPRLAANVNGLGDAIAALFLVHLARENDIALALQRAGSSVHGLLKRTVEAGSREILIIAAQDEFTSPSQLFPIEQLA
ncbi:pyridoxal kinase PdxY [Rhabdaerophilum sp. SD176]|uniref:pyridoxal kinase PdxY n=1 Tax=Rhabdaerophilum sp. SD176 TaxID=2983548 RepID=UPI0024DFB9DA|nr:pyridoxal kinase PdxY [Rhabdaerophilum sp. SD176]